MYHVLIVDDENLMRTYLAQIIPTLCPRFQICGLANDGLEAMELLEHQKFDLVLTDIRMPEMDGLSLAKYIYETSPDTKIIIVSGYNDFEYAKTAIRYHVSDYLLKPLNDQELSNILHTLEKKSAEKIRTPSNFSANTSSFELRTKYMEALMEDDSSNSDFLLAELEKRSFPYFDNLGCILVSTIDEADMFLYSNNIYEITTYSLKLNSIIKEYCYNKNMVTYYKADGQTYILLDAADEKTLLTEVCYVYNELSMLVQKKKLPKIIFSSGCSFTDIMNLKYSAHLAYSNIALTLMGAKSPLFFEQSIENKHFINEINNSCQIVYSNLLSSSMDSLQINLRNYCRYMEECLTISSIIRYAVHLLKYIYSRSNIKTQFVKAA